MFNDFFSNQCSTIFNYSSLPTNLTSKTEIGSLLLILAQVIDIVKIAKALEPNKAHGHDKISIRMIKLCAFLISKPMHILSKNCLENEFVPSE